MFSVLNNIHFNISVSSIVVFNKCVIYLSKHFYVGQLHKTEIFLICVVGGGIKVHSTLRPLNGLLCQPRVIMIMEKSVE
jgi:hypothetical protein